MVTKVQTITHVNLSSTPQLSAHVLAVIIRQILSPRIAERNSGRVTPQIIFAQTSFIFWSLALQIRTPR
jgi:hypothetical protein